MTAVLFGSRHPSLVTRHTLLRGWLAAALPLFLHGCAAPFDDVACAAPQAPVAVPATGEIRLISWNVHGLPFDGTLDRRIDNLSAEIRRRRPDLVLLQEVWTAGAAARFDCRLRGEYEAVPDAEGVRAGPLAPFGHRRGGLLALVRRDSPWKIDPAAARRFTEYEASGLWYQVMNERDGIAGKGIQFFAIGDGAARIAVMHTHLQAQYEGRDYAEVRRAQIRQLLGQADGAGAEVMLVAGDFNTHPGEAAIYGEMTRGLSDLTAEYHRACACGTLAGAGRGPRHWIDYVLARPAGAVKLESKAGLIRNTAVREPYSDHHGLWLQMRIGWGGEG